MAVTITRCCYDEDCMLRKMSHFQEVGPDDKPPIMVQRKGSSANVFFSVRTFSRLLSVFRIRNKKHFKNKSTWSQNKIDFVIVAYKAEFQNYPQINKCLFNGMLYSLHLFRTALWLPLCSVKNWTDFTLIWRCLSGHSRI